MPDTRDYAFDDAAHDFVASLPPSMPAPEPLALRSLPVREASDSSRVDVPKVAASTPLQTTAEGDVWFSMVQGLLAQEAITALVRELALQSQLVARDTDQWVLRIERESLNHAASRERLQTALTAAGHGQVRLQIELGAVQDCPAKRMAVAAAAKMEAAQALIENDPLVQTMMRDFGAKIVPGSLQVI
jgi:DNA polymerase III subunit gamma/tau